MSHVSPSPPPLPPFLGQTCLVACCFSSVLSRAFEQEESDFLDPLREQLGYLGSAKEVHRGRGRTLDALQVRSTQAGKLLIVLSFLGLQRYLWLADFPAYVVLPICLLGFLLLPVRSLGCLLFHFKCMTSLPAYLYAYLLQ